MTTAQRILKNFLSLTTADIVTKLLGIITVSYLARVLGPADFGKINFALAIVGYFAILSHFGLNTIGTREIARDKKNINDYTNNILSLKLFLGTCVFCLLVIFAILLNKSLDVKYLIVFYGFTMFTVNVLLLDWVFQGIEKMEYLAISFIIQGTLYLCFILLFIKNSQQMLFIPWILVLAQVAADAFLILIFNQTFSIPKVQCDLSQWKNLFKQALPIGFSGIMTIIILNTGIVILGFVRPVEEIGYFAATYKVIWIFLFLATSFATAIFPTISNYYVKSIDLFHKLLHYTYKSIIAVGLPASTGITILAKQIIELLYGTNFSNAIIVLQILIWNALLMCIHTISVQILLAANFQNVVMRIAIIRVIGIILSNVILILKFGLIGACIAPIIIELIALILYNCKVKTIANMNIFQYILKPAISSIIMCLFLYKFSNWPLFSLIFAGMVIYFSCFYYLKGTDMQEIKFILKAMRNK